MPMDDASKQLQMCAVMEKLKALNNIPTTSALLPTSASGGATTPAVNDSLNDPLNDSLNDSLATSPVTTTLAEFEDTSPLFSEEQYKVAGETHQPEDDDPVILLVAPVGAMEPPKKRKRVNVSKSTASVCDCGCGHSGAVSDMNKGCRKCDRGATYVLSCCFSKYNCSTCTV